MEKEKSMMKKLVVLVVLAGLATGCGVIPASGLLATTTKVPGWYYGDDNPTGASKTGQACLSNYLMLFATGDASIAQAMANGNIKNVSTIDHSVESYLFLYARYCTIVKGD